MIVKFLIPSASVSYARKAMKKFHNLKKRSIFHSFVAFWAFKIFSENLRFLLSPILDFWGKLTLIFRGNLFLMPNSIKNIIVYFS